MPVFDFREAVLDRSYDKPVLVDFWAPWCGPCRVLGPVLEQLAAEQHERWELVKINTEDEQELAMDYQIQSIPNVKLFHQGKVIGEFLGALPRPAVIKWLDEHLPDERKMTLSALLSNLDNGDDSAFQNLLHFVEDNPDVPEAALALAKRIVFNSPEKAASLVRSIQAGSEWFEAAEDVRTLAAFLQFEADESPAARLLDHARQAALSGDLETAIQQVIEAVTIDKNYRDGLPRLTAIALFRTLGSQHLLTKNYRWRFDMALY